jgi:hypothetical protein
MAVGETSASGVGSLVSYTGRTDRAVWVTVPSPKQARFDSSQAARLREGRTSSGHGHGWLFSTAFLPEGAAVARV